MNPCARGASQQLCRCGGLIVGEMEIWLAAIALLWCVAARIETPWLTARQLSFQTLIVGAALSAALVLSRTWGRRRAGDRAAAVQMDNDCAKKVLAIERENELRKQATYQSRAQHLIQLDGFWCVASRACRGARLLIMWSVAARARWRHAGGTAARLIVLQHASGWHTAWPSAACYRPCPMRKVDGVATNVHGMQARSLLKLCKVGLRVRAGR